eukprot:scaffold16334_cov97-Phaeocystis_antarctica.AAC.8
MQLVRGNDRACGAAVGTLLAGGEHRLIGVVACIQPYPVYPAIAGYGWIQLDKDMAGYSWIWLDMAGYGWIQDLYR